MRKFKQPEYEAMLNSSIRLSEAVPEEHLARFVVGVVSLLDMQSIYQAYSEVGGEAIAPEVLVGLWMYGYATGGFSSGRSGGGRYESLPFRFVAGGLHPDHDTIANFRKTFLPQLQELFVQVLLLANEVGVLKVGNISLDGSKIHADASKSKAVSHKRLLELETRLRTEVQELLRLGERADQGEIVVPGGLGVEDEIARRHLRLE